MGGACVSGGGRQRRLRSALVVLEVALALLLLDWLSLLLKALRTCARELGFKPGPAAGDEFAVALQWLKDRHNA